MAYTQPPIYKIYTILHNIYTTIVFDWFWPLQPCQNNEVDRLSQAEEKLAISAEYSSSPPWLVKIHNANVQRSYNWLNKSDLYYIEC